MLDLDRLPNTISTPNLMDFTSAESDVSTLNSHLKEAEIERFLKDTKLRTILVYIFSGIIFSWLASVILILWFNNTNLCLSDNVLIVLLTTTTINIIGMMLIILRNLFPTIKK